jgi:hypothetical protein
MKNVSITHIPDDFKVAESFRFGLTDGEIIQGIEAFRVFLYALYDKIAVDDFPVIPEISALLYYMGAQGRLETEPVPTLIVNGSDLLIKNKKNSQAHQAVKKMTSKRAAELFTFLSDMGFYFEGIDYTKQVKLAEIGVFHITNENDSHIIVGLKLLAAAQAHILTDWERLQFHFMRCEFHPLESEASQWYDVKLLDCVNTQPPAIKEWLIDLHTFLTAHGCTAEGGFYEYANFTYTAPKSKKMICRIDMPLSGCTLVPNTVKVKCLDGIAPTLSEDFIKALKEGGCTCERKCKRGPYKIIYKGETYISCHNPPHKVGGFNIPLKNTKDRGILRKWVELER